MNFLTPFYANAFGAKIGPFIAVAAVAGAGVFLSTKTRDYTFVYTPQKKQPPRPVNPYGHYYYPQQLHPYPQQSYTNPQQLHHYTHQGAPKIQPETPTNRITSVAQQKLPPHHMYPPPQLYKPLPAVEY